MQKLIFEWGPYGRGFISKLNAIGVFLSDKDESSLIGHVPKELSCVFTKSLLNAATDKLEFSGKRERKNVGPIVPANYKTLKKSKILQKFLLTNSNGKMQT